MTHGTNNLSESAEIERQLSELHKQHRAAMAALEWEKVTLIQGRIAGLQRRLEQLRCGSVV